MSSANFAEESIDSKQQGENSQDSSVSSQTVCSRIFLPLLINNFSESERECIAERKRKSMTIWKSREMFQDEHKSGKIVVDYKLDNVARTRAFFKAKEADFNKRQQSVFLRASSSTSIRSPPLVTSQFLQSVRDLNKSFEDFSILEKRADLTSYLRRCKSNQSSPLEPSAEKQDENTETVLPKLDLDAPTAEERAEQNTCDKQDKESTKEEKKENTANGQLDEEKLACSATAEPEKKIENSVLTENDTSVKDENSSIEREGSALKTGKDVHKDELIPTEMDESESQTVNDDKNVTVNKLEKDENKVEKGKDNIDDNNISKELNQATAEKRELESQKEHDKCKEENKEDNNIEQKEEQTKKDEDKLDSKESLQTDIEPEHSQEDFDITIKNESMNTIPIDYQNSEKQKCDENVSNEKAEKSKKEITQNNQESEEKSTDIHEDEGNDVKNSEKVEVSNEHETKDNQHKHKKRRSKDPGNKTREHKHKTSTNLTERKHKKLDEDDSIANATEGAEHENSNQEVNDSHQDEHNLYVQRPDQEKDERDEPTNGNNSEIPRQDISPSEKIKNKPIKAKRKNSVRGCTRKHSSSDAGSKRPSDITKDKAPLAIEELSEKQVSDTELETPNKEKEIKEKERKKKRKENRYHTMREGVGLKLLRNGETSESGHQEKDNEVPILSDRRKELKNATKPSNSKYSTISIMKQTFTTAPITSQEKRKLILQEIYVSEEYYVQKLKLLVENVQKPLLEAAKTPKPIITPQEIATLFSSPHLEIIYRYNSIILNGLRKCKENQEKNEGTTESVGTIFYKMSDFLKTYSFYSTQFQKMTQSYDTIMKGPLLEFVTKALQDAGESLDLLSLLIMPVQRVPRYVLLLKELLRCTDKDDPEYQKITESLTRIENIATQLNDKQIDMENRKKLTKIQSMIVGANSLQLISPTRVFKREGPMFTLKGSSLEQVYVFLFNDLLVSTVDGKGTYRYKTSIEINDHTEVGSHLFAPTSEHHKRSGTLRRKTLKKDEKLPEVHGEEEEKKPVKSTVRNMFVLAGSKTSKKKSKFATFSPGRNDGTGSDIIAFCGKDEGETREWEALIKDLIRVQKLNKESFSK